MAFNRQKSRVGENSESHARNQPGKNICEGNYPRLTVFIQEQNDLFIQQVLQYSQKEKSDELHYHILGLNESSA